MKTSYIFSWFFLNFFFNFFFLKYLVQLGLDKDLSLERIEDELSYKGTEDFSFFETHFEQYLISTTSQYYSKKTQIWRNLQTPEYVNLAKNTLIKEEERANKYFPRSIQKYISVIQNRLIADMADCITKVN